MFPWKQLQDKGHQLVDLDEILYGGDNIKGDVDHSKMADV
jgi:hypothetical protein